MVGLAVALGRLVVIVERRVVGRSWLSAFAGNRATMRRLPSPQPL